ncbi:MAG: hypoxanthine phosphoribosyltransferase [Gemmatimonadota bacterium]
MASTEPVVLIPEDRIRERVAALGAQISADYAGVDELVLVGVLRGCYIFLADLSRRLAIPRRIDFIALASYGQAGTVPGAVRLIMDLRTDIAGKHVLIVEDIVDTGHTLQYLLGLLRSRGPASLKACALLRKPDRLEADVRIDYLGFDIPDAWVVGYGLDYGDRDRALPYIGVIEPGRGGAGAGDGPG